MAKKSKKTTKKKISPSKKSPHKQSSPKKKIDLQPKNVKKPQRPKKKSKKIERNEEEEEDDFELQRDKILAELTEDEYDELVFGNDIENMPHDIFDTYDEPSTEKENKEYIKKLINE